MPQLSLVPEKRIHIAIMRKSWGLTEKILTGEKTIESRWYKNKARPWDQIEEGDEIYFKNTGEPVKIKATVAKVLQFENLSPNKVREILMKYGPDDGIGVEESDLEKYFSLFKDKRYCILVFLKNPQQIEPFEINKKGFGAMAAWITVDKLEEILKQSG